MQKWLKKNCFFRCLFFSFVDVIRWIISWVMGFGLVVIVLRIRVVFREKAKTSRERITRTARAHIVRNEIVCVGVQSTGDCSQKNPLQLSATAELRRHKFRTIGPFPLGSRVGPQGKKILEFKKMKFFDLRDFKSLDWKNANFHRFSQWIRKFPDFIDEIQLKNLKLLSLQALLAFL